MSNPKRSQFNGVYQIDEKHIDLVTQLAKDDDQWFQQNPDKEARIRPLFEEEVPRQLRHNNYVVVFRTSPKSDGPGLSKRAFLHVPTELVSYMESISYDTEQDCPVYTFSKKNMPRVRKLMKKYQMDATGEFEDVDQHNTGSFDY